MYLFFRDTALYDVPNFTSTHQVRSDSTGGGISVYVHNSLSFKTRLALSIDSDNVYRSQENNCARVSNIICFIENSLVLSKVTQMNML